MNIAAAKTIQGGRGSVYNDITSPPWWWARYATVPNLFVRCSGLKVHLHSLRNSRRAAPQDQ